MGDTSYTYVDFTILEEEYNNFQAYYKQINGVLETLDQEVKGSLSQWDGSARTAYNSAKAQWDSAALDMATTLNQLGGVVDVASQNFGAAEVANTKAWEV